MREGICPHPVQIELSCVIHAKSKQVKVEVFKKKKYFKSVRYQQILLE